MNPDELATATKPVGCCLTFFKLGEFSKRKLQYASFQSIAMCGTCNELIGFDWKRGDLVSMCLWFPLWIQRMKMNALSGSFNLKETIKLNAFRDHLLL